MAGGVRVHNDSDSAVLVDDPDHTSLEDNNNNTNPDNNDDSNNNGENTGENGNNNGENGNTGDNGNNNGENGTTGENGNTGNNGDNGNTGGDNNGGDATGGNGTGGTGTGGDGTGGTGTGDGSGTGGTGGDGSGTGGDGGAAGDGGGGGAAGGDGGGAGGDGGGGGGDPVVLDLDGNGIELIRKDRSTVTFDLDHDGYRERTAWVGPHDGILVIDLAADGSAGPDSVIDQDRELVFTRWASGTTSDMAALRAVFDTNHNGKLDAGDARFSEFRIWIDANQNGRSDPGELKTLGELGIVSIDLQPHGSAVDLGDGGTRVNGFSSFTRADGTRGLAGDLTIGYDTNGFQAAATADGFRIDWQDGSSQRYFVAPDMNAGVSVDLSSNNYFAASGSNANDTFIGANGRANNVEAGLGDDYVVGGDQTDILMGDAGNDDLRSQAGRDLLIGGTGNDRLDGGAGADVLAGGTGSDIFILDGASVADAQSHAGFDRIVDYDRSSGAFNAAEGDRIDLSQILQGPYGSGQPLGTLVRAVQAGDGALLQVDADGAANGERWLTLARLEGVRFGDTVTIDLTGSGSGLQSISVLQPSTGDFSSDHSSDILWRTDAGALAIWDLSGTRITDTGNFQIGATVINADGPNWHILGTGDFDGDGHADVLWASDQGYTAVWELDGNQVKMQDALRSGANPVTRPDPSWHIAGSNDFDGDGKGDILWRTENGTLVIWEIEGTQLKSADYVNDGAEAIPAPGADWHIAGTDDFDGDGKADMLWRADSGTLVIWEMDGTRIKFGGYVNDGAQAVPAPGADWHIAGTADFDGDGKNDILWRTDSGMLAIWEMDGTRIKFGGYVNNGTDAVGAPGADWHVQQLGDYDGDGKNDILWRTDSGSLAIWEMDGTRVKFQGYVNNGIEAVGAPGPDWHIVKPDYYMM